VTDAATVRVVNHALEAVNHRLVQQIEALGGHATGMTAKQKVIAAEPHPKADRLGFVGVVGWVHTRLIRGVFNRHAIPVISPVGVGHDRLYNVNADDVASEVAGETADPWQQVLALQHWVHASLAKRLTVGLPSAIDVLASKSGDCHEHTVLFTALARSLGMPTRMIAGLVSYGGRLFYHAWPEVWLGGWIPVDPTLGQALADATHLGLIEAENEQLVGLGAFLGHLKVEVLEADEQ